MRKFITIGLVVIFQAAYSQYADKNFTRYSVRDGLSDNGINCIQQDEQGYIWIGTDAGLNRFDGKNFKTYHQGLPPFNLLSPGITKLKRFKKDELAILSRGGLQLVNTRDYSVKSFTVTDTGAFITQANAAWEANVIGNNYALTTASGFYVFDKNGKIVFRKDGYGVKDIGKKRILYGRDFFEIEPGKYLVYVNEGSLAIFNDNQKTFNELDLEKTELNFFMHDRMPGGKYWVVKQHIGSRRFIFIPYRQDKIIYYDLDKKTTVTSALPLKMADSLNWESRITIINDSSFALNSATNGFYILRLDKKTGKISCSGEKFLRDYKVISMFTDKDQRLWVGTTEGLLKQELYPSVISAHYYPPEPGKKFTGGFNCAYRYKDKLYAGRFSRSKGLIIVNPENMQLLKVVEFYGDNSQWNEIRTIEMYYKDTLWIGTNLGIIWYDTKTDNYGKLSDDPKYAWAEWFSAVLAPARDDGYAWICSMLGGKVARYHIASRTYTIFTSETKPALPFEKVKHIVYDSYGDVWIAGHSLARWNNKLQDFDTLITVYGGINKYNDDIITIRADNKGSLWMHNLYNGILQYKIPEKKFVAYSIKDGLPSDNLHAMSPVINDKIWVAANNRLSCLDTKTGQVIIYSQEDGLPEPKPTGRKIYYDELSGQLYVFHNEFLVRFPFVPETRRDLGSNLFIEELTIGNNKTVYQPGDKLKFRHNENYLTVNYSIIDFEKSNYQFAYKLNNNDEWNAVGNQRSINLSNLSPGSYSLQIRATGKPGSEKISTLNFAIQPPFWKTAWFIGLAILLVASSIYFLYQFRVKQIRQKADLDKQLSQTEMKALQAQMNPHFIFNSLNSIREMILNNENKDASHYLSKFAHLIRISLDQSSRGLVTLGQTIDYLQRYLEMEQLRNSLFTYKINVDERLAKDETLLPPMLIQPFIENSLWHGVTANGKNIHVTIDFIKEKNGLLCVIDDNGIGINQSKKNKPDLTVRHKPHGISNIQTRMRLLNEKYKLDSHITIEDKSDLNGNTESGTRVTLHLPLDIREA